MVMENIFREELVPNGQQTATVPVCGSPQSVPGVQNESQDAVTPVTGQRKRKRTLYSKWQQMELESVFAVIPYPDINTREHLANIIRLPESKVQVWFQNRRARKSKSGKLDRSLYKRGSSFRNQHFSLNTGIVPQGYGHREPLITMQYPPNHGAQYVPDKQQGVAMQQPPYQEFTEPPYSFYQQYMREEDHYITSQHDTQWEQFTQNNTSPGYGFEATLYETKLMELEQFMAPSQMQCFQKYPYTMNENASQISSIGNISDVIYNAAILTNVDEC
ncbi:homeobox protein SEBOX [Discoglossus pictus]